MLTADILHIARSGACGVIVLPGAVRRHVPIFDTGYEPTVVTRLPSNFKPF
jgi:hypothetical protein